MAEEKGRVLLFGRRWSGRTTLANMLVSGEIGDCPLNPTDIDSICETYVGRGWTVIDTMGFGDPLDRIAADEYATEMGINFLNEIRGSYSHIIFVLDGREVGCETPPPGLVEHRKHTLSMWKTFLEIFRGGEERFVIVVTKVTSQEFKRRAWKRISREMEERFPECKQLLWSDFFNEGQRGEALEKLEKGMEEICKGRPWVEPNVGNMGDDEIKEMAARITHQLTSTVLDDPEWETLGSTYDMPDDMQRLSTHYACPPSQKKTLYGIVNTILKVRDEIENLENEVKLYPQQCEYLLKRTKDAANEIHDLIDGNEMDWHEYKYYYPEPLNKSLRRVLSCMKVVEELLHLCGEGVDEEVVLTMTSRTDLGTNFFSKFAMVLHDLEWFLDVFRFWWHILKAEGFIESEWAAWLSKFYVPEALCATETERLPWRSKFSWCETRCRLVYVEDGKNGIAGTQFVECGNVIGDSQRHAQDQQDLISSMECLYQNPKMVQIRRTRDFFLCRTRRMEHLSDIERLNYISVLRNRLQGDSTFQRPSSCSSSSSSSSMVPRCFQIPRNQKYKSIRLIGQGGDKEVSKCKWLGMNVALATSENTTAFEVEAEMLARVQHPNVVTLIGYDYDEEKQKGFLVMELMETSLESMINKAMFNPYFWKETYPFSILDAIDILLQIVKAMIHVHECGVIHGDLKPGNCVYSRKIDRTKSDIVGICVGEVKLIDFGTAQMDSEFKRPNIGTLGYRAPEVYKRVEDPKGNSYTLSCDVYNFGMTCYQVITGNRPFGALRGYALQHKVCNSVRPDIPSNCPHELRKLMTECWTDVAEDRPTFKDIQRRLWNFKLDYSIWK